MGGPVRFVLVRPARAANVAAACRAMANMGFGALTLVDPPASVDDFDERASAYGAFEVLDTARRVPTLADAVADCAFVAGTSGRQGDEDWTPRRLAAEWASRGPDVKMALVFGPERTGLTASELRSCHARVRIQTSPRRSSLNLAQAVLVIAYELFLADHRSVEPRADVALPAAEIESILEELKRGLLGIGYLNPQQPEGVLSELRRLLARARPTPREGTLLRGLARQVAWAAEEIARHRGPRG